MVFWARGCSLSLRTTLARSVGTDSLLTDPSSLVMRIVSVDLLACSTSPNRATNSGKPQLSPASKITVSPTLGFVLSNLRAICQRIIEELGTVSRFNMAGGS